MRREHAVLVVVLTALLALSACGGPAGRTLGEQASPLAGCTEALRARAEAVAAIEAAAAESRAKDRGRAQQFEAIRREGVTEIASTADLRSCDDASTGTGVSVDAADLRARYRVVVERTGQRLADAATQPVPRQDTKNKGTKGGDD